MDLINILFELVSTLWAFFKDILGSEGQIFLAAFLSVAVTFGILDYINENPSFIKKILLKKTRWESIFVILNILWIQYGVFAFGCYLYDLNPDFISWMGFKVWFLIFFISLSLSYYFIKPIYDQDIAQKELINKKIIYFSNYITNDDLIDQNPDFDAWTHFNIINNFKKIWERDKNVDNDFYILAITDMEICLGEHQDMIDNESYDILYGVLRKIEKDAFSF
tara:strand:+ start:531 stop:1196 length:666 start_codon:yes stop_codon:yes gene_type:complete